MLHGPHEGNVIAACGRVCVCNAEIEGDAVVCANLLRTSGKAVSECQTKRRSN